MSNKENNDIFNVLTQGVNNQIQGDLVEGIIETIDDTEEATIIIDTEEETYYPEYIVEASLHDEKLETLIETESEKSEEVEFISFDEEEDLEDLDIDLFGEEDVLIPKEKKGIDLLDIEEVPEDFSEDSDEVFFDDDEFEGEELEEDEFDEDTGFSELSWGSDDFEEDEDEFLDEETLIEEVIVEEDVVEEDIIEEQFVEENELDTVNKVPEVQEKPDLETGQEVIEEDTKFKNCIFYNGMTIEDYLRENPEYRDKEYVEHFFKSSVINDALTRGRIFLKKGKFRI